MSKPLSLKELLAQLDDDEKDGIVERAMKNTPVRLPNFDWNDDDPAEMIDFPCSDIWLSYYHLRGKTPRHPIDYPGIQSVTERNTTVPIEGTGTMAKVDINTQTRAEVKYLRSKVEEHLDKSTKKDRYERYV